jgi:arabinogalactan endo-1,4-beta-galactosidase
MKKVFIYLRLFTSLRWLPLLGCFMPIILPAQDFAKGADISWLPQMEATGYKFYNEQGVEQDCFQILKDHGINTIRLRTWVNPSQDRASGHCSKEETVAMAVRALQWGMRVMIDFHYSDSWADPGKQKKPAAWEGHDFPQLLKDVYDYTTEVMKSLRASGVTPEWVQLGNETASGMIYPEGSTSNWKGLAQLINQGYDAVKAVSPQSKVILHVDQGNNNARFRAWFDSAQAHAAKYEVIGLSYYPYWLQGSPDYTFSIDDLAKNLNDMASRYGKEVMVVEVGGEDTKAQNTYDMLVAVQKKVKAVPQGKGLGVVYWEPEGARSWSKYAFSAWGDNGRPTKALDAFRSDIPLGNEVEESAVSKAIQLHPNPARNQVTIEWKDFEQGPVQVTIADTTGASVYQQELKGNKKQTISTAPFRSGTYMVTLKSAQVMGRKKLVIKK